jgi:hypothetical protein
MRAHFLDIRPTASDESASRSKIVACSFSKRATAEDSSVVQEPVACRTKPFHLTSSTSDAVLLRDDWSTTAALELPCGRGWGGNDCHEIYWKTEPLSFSHKRTQKSTKTLSQRIRAFQLSVNPGAFSWPPKTYVRLNSQESFTTEAQRHGGQPKLSLKNGSRNPAPTKSPPPCLCVSSDSGWLKPHQLESAISVHSNAPPARSFHAHRSLQSEGGSKRPQSTQPPTPHQAGRVLGARHPIDPRKSTRNPL